MYMESSVFRLFLCICFDFWTVLWPDKQWFMSVWCFLIYLQVWCIIVCIILCSCSQKHNKKKKERDWVHNHVKVTYWLKSSVQVKLLRWMTVLWPDEQWFMSFWSFLIVFLVIRYMDELNKQPVCSIFSRSEHENQKGLQLQVRKIYRCVSLFTAVNSYIHIIIWIM